MNKPQIRFKGFEDEWKQSSFGALLNYIQPQSYIVKSSKYKTRGIPVLTAGKSLLLGYTDERFGVFNNLPCILFDDFTTDSKFIDYPFKVKSSAAKMLVPFAKDANIYLLYLIMQNTSFEHSSHRRYWINEYSNIPIFLPSNAEQKQLTSIFAALDEMIAEAEREVNRLEKMKQASLQKMFPRPGAIAPEIRVGGFTEPWFSFRLCDISSYRSSSLKVSDAQQNGKYVLYDANNPIGYIDSEPIRSEYVSIIKDGAGVGRCRLLPKNTFIIGTLGAIIPKENCHIDFLYNIISNLRLGEKISGSTIPHIYFSEYGLTQILAPSFSEQKAIGKYFRNLDSLLSAKRQKLVILRNIKQACLDKMFVNTFEL